MKTRIATSLLLTAALGACAAGPDYRPASPAALGVPDAYQAPAAAAGDPQSLVTWWERFDDPLLTNLVQRSIADNLDIAVASARLRQAREALVQARAGYVPTLDASGGVSRSLGDGNDRTSFSLGSDASWEVDLFGRIGRSVEAARADAEGADYDLAGVRTAIIAETASNYISARLAQERLAIARDSLAIADDNLEIAGWRVQAGLVSSLDSEQARAARAQTAASIPGIETSYAAAAYRLAVLTGQAPGAINPALDPVRPVPGGPADIAVGIPADTLRQRPDVRGAERSLAAATARIGVAQAQLYPSLRIGGNIGTSAFSLGGLFDTITGSLFAGIGQTIFDGGRLRSQVRSQQAAAEGAYASYRRTVLQGLEDVENALQALTAAQRREREFAIALDAANNTAILARSQYRAGLTDFQTLLQAERSLLSSRDGQASARAERALALVQLYRALGGGWDPLAEGNEA